jgi:glycerophosphoryl diester phosphodiesterase
MGASGGILTVPFPWLCAHRGLSVCCPENTLPAFGAALALGVHEIELDLWLSRDGVPVVMHDAKVDRTTDGKGVIASLDWADIRRLDAGARTGDAWRGVRVPRFEEALDFVQDDCLLNIHIKDPGPDGRLVVLVRDRLRAAGCVDTAYIAGDEDVLQAGVAHCPEIARACLAGQKEPARQVAIALRYRCRRVQFGRHADADCLRRAREAGLVCNLFWSDDAVDAREWVARGIDVLLTNAPHTLIVGGFAPAAGRGARSV